MAQNIKYFPVNWIEGMKINKNHFIELQDNIEDIVRDTRNLSVDEYNFGFLSTHLSTPFQYSVFIDTHNELSIDIKFLKAVTPAGGRIEITENTGPFFEKVELKEQDFKESEYYVLLNLNPYQRIPFGEQNMAEVPPRFPNSISKYFITTIAKSEVTQNNIGALQIPIAKFKVSKTGDYEISSTYIPPCLTVNSHSSLITVFESYDLLFKQIEFNSVQIIKKIKLRNLSEDENVIAGMVREMCDKALRYVEQQITINKWENYKTKPLTIFNNITSFARSLKNCFDTYSGDGKEMLFNYFSEWTDIKSGDYEKIFSDAVNIKYTVYDVEEILKHTNYFIPKMDSLFSILSQLDYIGRKKDTGIFVNENVLKNEKISSSIFGNENKPDDKSSNSSPSFLAD
jgi:hypothetical protein